MAVSKLGRYLFEEIIGKKDNTSEDCEFPNLVSRYPANCCASKPLTNLILRHRICSYAAWHFLATIAFYHAMS